MAFPDTFKALSDPVRRQILLMLRGGRMSAGEIAQQFDLTGASISYHLSQLKKADLVSESKYKNFVYYELNLSVFEELAFWFSQFGKGVINSAAPCFLPPPSVCCRCCSPQRSILSFRTRFQSIGTPPVSRTITPQSCLPRLASPH